MCSFYNKVSLVCFILFSISVHSLFGQVFSNKEIGKNKVTVEDSIKNSVYPYLLPIWGQKAMEAGFTLPLSAGLSAQYFYSESDILINNLSVGFNNGPMYDLDGIVRFENTQANVASYTIRPDVWVFPFLNVYGILGKSQATTDVGFGVWIPDATGSDRQIFSAATQVDFNTTTFGLGMTPTIGVGGGFIALDMNFAWTDVPQLEKPARSFVFGPRFGKAFNLKKPNSNIAVWVGGFRVAISGETSGSLDLSEVFPEGGGEFEMKVNNGIIEVGNAQMEVDTWWANLSILEQSKI